MMTDAEKIEALEKEPVNLGRIDANEFMSNPDIVRDKLEALIDALLSKYGYGIALKNYSWRYGDPMPTAEIGIEKISAPSVKDPEPWDFVKQEHYPEIECPSCHRTGKVARCNNGMHRCPKCEWVIELNAICPVTY